MTIISLAIGTGKLHNVTEHFLRGESGAYCHRAALTMIDSLPTPGVVQRQLDRLLASEAFAKSLKLAAFLELIVTSTLNATEITQYDMGRRVFDQAVDWVPNEEASIVRTNKYRLEKLLANYYETEGADDPVVITIVGWKAVFKYNHRSPFMPAPPSALNVDFVTTLQNYFADPNGGALLCVVTGSPADWYHLDGDPYNNAMGNLIPLCEPLRSHIDGLRTGRKTTNLPELDPRYLAEELARRHVAHWQTARAYGCAHLAFHMGEPPYGEESTDARIQYLCDVLSHLRHRFNESIVAYVIRHSLLPLVTRLDSLDARPMCHLTLQLSGLLEESGYFEAAAGALALAEGLMDSFGNLVYRPGSLNRFSLLRWRAQSLMEREPADKRFIDLMTQAVEQIGDNANLRLTLEVVTTTRSFRQGTIPPSRRAYDALLPLVGRYTDMMFSGRRLEAPPLIDSSNLASIYLFSGIAACRVRPDGWEEFAHEMMAKGKRLCQESGFTLPPEFWETVSEETFEANPIAQRVSQLSNRYIRPRLRDSVRIDIETILKRLKNMLVLEKGERLLSW